MNLYIELKTKHQREVNDLPIHFAFGQEQFDEMMVEFGLDPSDTAQIYSLNGGAGGYVLKNDFDLVTETFDRHERERAEAIAADKRGTQYIYHMFRTELENSEYGWTQCVEDALDRLGLTYEDFESNPALGRGLEKAKKSIKMFCF